MNPTDDDDDFDCTGRGWHTLTSYGRNMVQLAFRLTNPQSLFDYQRKGSKSLDDCTEVELVQMLSQKGWHDEVTKKPSKAKPFSGANSERVWWRRPCSRISTTYLKALVDSDQILLKNDAIHHFQPKAYYACLLQGCIAAPRQPLVYYKKVLSLHKSKGKKRRANVKPPVDLESAAPNGDLSNLTE